MVTYEREASAQAGEIGVVVSAAMALLKKCFFDAPHNQPYTFLSVEKSSAKRTVVV